MFILLGAGFRSRVKYISVLDPTVRCYYVSEVLDARQDGPLFMVFIFSFFHYILLFLLIYVLILKVTCLRPLELGIIEN